MYYTCTCNYCIKLQCTFHFMHDEYIQKISMNAVTFDPTMMDLHGEIPYYLMAIMYMYMCVCQWGAHSCPLLFVV